MLKQHLNDFIISEIASPSFRTCRPRIINKSLIPQGTLDLMEVTWAREWFQDGIIRIFMLENVYIAGEEIVFDEEFKPIPAFLTQQVEDHVSQAKQQLLEALSSGNISSISDPSVLCVKPGWRNYGHWLIELLPIAELASRVVKDQKLQYVVASQSSQNMRLVVDNSLSALGVSNSSVCKYDFNPVFFEKLICVTGLTIHGTFMSPLVFNAINTLRRGASSSSVRKLYLKRRSGRTFADDDGVSKFLSNLGYHVVYPEDLTLYEQVSLLKGADKVIGIAGAAMTNIAFCRVGAQVVICYPSDMPDTFFWFIGEHRNLSLTDVRCEQTGNSRTHLSWDRQLQLNLNQIKHLL